VGCVSERISKTSVDAAAIAVDARVARWAAAPTLAPLANIDTSGQTWNHLPIVAPLAWHHCPIVAPLPKHESRRAQPAN